jgi:hypothetical protein
MFAVGGGTSTQRRRAPTRPRTIFILIFSLRARANAPDANFTAHSRCERFIIERERVYARHGGARIATDAHARRSSAQRHRLRTARLRRKVALAAVLRRRRRRRGIAPIRPVAVARHRCGDGDDDGDEVCG